MADLDRMRSLQYFMGTGMPAAEAAAAPPAPAANYLRALTGAGMPQAEAAAAVSPMTSGQMPVRPAMPMQLPFMPLSSVMQRLSADPRMAQMMQRFAPYMNRMGLR